MKTLIAVSIVAVMALTSSANAGGLFSKRTNTVLSNITGIAAGVSTGKVNVLNGNTVAVGNNSNILSGIGNGNANGNANGLLNGVLNGNGLLGLGGNNKRHW